MKLLSAMFVVLCSMGSAAHATPQTSVEEDYVWQERFNERLNAAQSGNAEAQFNIGEMFEKGSGVSIDLERAFGWFERAAKQNHQKARFKLAYMYYRGEGTETNHTKAFQLMETLANGGYTRAQYYLGLMYETGVVTTRSAERATAWYRRAAQGGSTQARDALADLTVHASKVTLAEESVDAREAGVALPPANLVPDPASATPPPERIVSPAVTTMQPPVAALPSEAARGTEPAPRVEAGLAIPALTVSAPAAATVASIRPAIEILPTTYSLLANGNWVSPSNRPMEFLPSTATSCERSGTADLECSTNEIVSVIANTEVAYQTHATVWDIQPSGEFKVRYRNNVLKILRNLDPENPVDRSQTVMGIGLGWQATEHHLECKIEISQTIRCVKNKTTTLTIRNQTAF